MKTKKTTDKRPKALLSARVPRDLHAALWREADRQDITLSQLVSDMLEDARARGTLREGSEARA